MKKIYNAFEDFAPEFKSMLSDHDITEPDEDEFEANLKEYLDAANSDDQSATEYLGTVLWAEKEVLVDFLDRYYVEANATYDYYETKYCRFGGGMNYLCSLYPLTLYLCWKYYESVGDTDKAKTSYLYLLCSFVQDEETWDYFIDYVNEGFDTVKEFIYADWLTLHPQLTFSIGKYYSKVGDYRKAYKFFKLGSSLDYEGRQSMEPFIEVGKNQYELGMLYMKGLGIKQNFTTAKDYFLKAAGNAGERSLPVIGDMYYEGLGVKQNKSKALEAYASYNRFNLDLYVYYKYLNELQSQRLEELLHAMGESSTLTFDDINWMKNVYKDRLNDEESAEKCRMKALAIAKSTPLEDRSDEMDVIYVDSVVESLRKDAVEPTENTGFIPEDLKVGDTFTFGIFLNEPIEWKVLELNDDGSAYVITTKILIKLYSSMGIEWLNTDFYKYSFTQEEKSHIKEHHLNYTRNNKPMYVYVPWQEQFIRLEGTYPEGTVKETEFAKSMSRNKQVMCFDGAPINPDGTCYNVIGPFVVWGVRPAMDVFGKPCRSTEKNCGSY